MCSALLFAPIQHSGGSSPFVSTPRHKHTPPLQALAFDFQTMKEPVSAEQLEAHKKFANNFVHLVSLMHGVALATLRDDFDMENIMVRALFGRGGVGSAVLARAVAG